jgi:hypothetical protein
MPVLARDAGVVEFAGEDFEGFSVEGEVVAPGGEDVRRFLSLRVCDRRKGNEEDGAEEESLHGCGAQAYRSQVSSLERMFQGRNLRVRRC